MFFLPVLFLSIIERLVMNYCTYAIKPQNSDRAVKLSSYMNLYRRPGVK
jgi:hypothetical protein